MLALDRALRERVFQKIADWSTDRFGRSCYWLAGQAAVLSMAGLAALEVRRATAGGLGWLDALALPLWLIFTGMGYAKAERLERRWRADPLKPPRLDPVDLTCGLIWIGFLALDLVDLALAIAFGAPMAPDVIHALWSAVTAAHYYFLSCLPRLPRPRRERARLPLFAAMETSRG